MKQFFPTSAPLASSAAASSAAPDTVSIQPTHQDILRRAEELWRSQGTPADRDDEIWREAERQLQREAAIAVAATRVGGARKKKVEF